METNFEPGRRFANHLDFQLQLDACFEKANARTHKTLRARPIDRLLEEREVMRSLPARTPDLDRRWVIRVPPDPHLRSFDFTFQRSVKRQVIEHLGQLEFLHAKQNVILLGPPVTGKTHISIALGIRACLAGHRVIFKTATEWVAFLADAAPRPPRSGARSAGADPAAGL
jgi:DNA replication protein DnaC